MFLLFIKKKKIIFTIKIKILEDRDININKNKIKELRFDMF